MGKSWWQQGLLRVRIHSTWSNLIVVIFREYLRPYLLSNKDLFGTSEQLLDEEVGETGPEEKKQELLEEFLPTLLAALEKG